MIAKSRIAAAYKMVFRIGASLAIVLLSALPVNANSHTPPMVGTITAPATAGAAALNCSIPLWGAPSGPNCSAKYPDGTSITLTSSGVTPFKPAGARGLCFFYPVLPQH